MCKCQIQLNESAAYYQNIIGDAHRRLLSYTPAKQEGNRDVKTTLKLCTFFRAIL